MNPSSRRLWQLAYCWLLFPLFVAALYVLSVRNPKIRDSLRGRRGVWRRLQEQLQARDPARPLVWFHVASAGEFLQALPVLERLIAAGGQCALTYTSVSAQRWVQRRRAALPGLVAADYLPLDFPGAMRRLIALLRPRALVHVKFDLWPNLIWQARAAGIPQVLVSATLQPLSPRVRWAVARSLYRTLYGSLDTILAVTEEDRRRFLQTCPEHPDVRAVGDTRFDSVLDRKRAQQPVALPAALRGDQVLVVGSSWPPDEELLLPVLQDALAELPGLRVIFAPHEIDAGHLERLERAFAGQPVARLTRLTGLEPQPSTPPLRVLLVDTVGLLAGLYAYATLAYVGGAFTTGVHNVMEPSVWGAPAVFGPFHQNSPEAVELVRRGQAFSIATREELRAVLLRLLRDPAQCRSIGRGAADFIERQAGAAQACFEIIEKRLA